ncbi:hypothetical protein TRVL_03054 [Trypanosoma vivax]|uniref:Uncharacterized protein n=1 Tax=Trypanosoma vivax (strain Y486) TaxID=1055687 RepID=G0TRY7_TRYVY|nr:hypothetical protein TRVL_03054 [Trypanosoma vivax]CCC46711.1 conserved hypothetical protein [Trypanosoma vivax Y486]
MTEVNNENLQALLTKIMSTRFCSGEDSDVKACFQNFVPPNQSNSWVEQSLHRVGVKKCEPYTEALHRCMGNEKKHAVVLKAAASAPVCMEERKKAAQCRLFPDRDCEQEVLEMLYCGMVHLIQKSKEKSGRQTL